MHKIQAEIFLFIILSFLTGCATTYKYGKEFRVENVKQIKIGVTTQEDVIHLFGKPLKKGIANGGDVFIYAKEEIRFKGSDVKKEGNTLVIEFDKNGVVKNYYFNIPGKEISVMNYVLYKKYMNEKEDAERECLDVAEN